MHSTYRALGSGTAHESNPAAAAMVNNKAAYTAAKVTSTALMIYATEKMWKRNRKGAIIFAVATNAAMAFVVTHNYRAVH